MSKQTVFVTLCVCATVITTAAILANAGPLTPPPGPVAPTPEIEPRIAINATNTPGDNDVTPSLFKITQPGSYYLEGNIAGAAGRVGVEIASSGVTLDLNGFDLRGVAGSFSGVFVSGAATNVQIRNGSVRDWGADGVDASFASNVSLTNLRASGNGAVGLRVGDGGVISACAAESNGGQGFVVAFNSRISACTATSNGDDGIFANAGSTITGCTANNNTGDGIHVSGDSLVLSNTCRNNGLGLSGDGAGIYVGGSDTRVEGNNVTDGDRGIDVDFAGNLIIRNSASDNTVNYDVVAGNTVGPTVTSTNIATNSNPHANYEF